MWIASSERSREIDRIAREERGISTEALMERAGAAVFEVVRHQLSRGGRMAVFCGKGNNGGDGLVVARLAQEDGYQIYCFVAAEEGQLSPDSRVQLELARARGVEPWFADGVEWARKLDCLGCRGLIVDALMGTGATGLVAGPVQQAIRAINRSGVPVVAVDVPSGIHCDTGEELGDAIWAAQTVTFGLPKPFLFQGAGANHSGHWSVAEIGFPQDLLDAPTPLGLLDADWVGCVLPERARVCHKGDSGTLLIVAGSRRYPGAATLAAKGALHSGAGLVIVAAIPSVCQAVAAQVPEAIFLPLPETDGVVWPEAARLVLEADCDAAVFGPGLTTERASLDFLTEVWRRWNRPCCIDADALNAVSMGLALPDADCVLTPHPGEMARLLHSTNAEVQADRAKTAERATVELRSAVVLKGAYTVIASRGETTMVNPTGNPGMATGGMGDVLAGVVGTLLAQSTPPYYAGACGAYWHGAAGDHCACDDGPVGFTASQLASALPLARATILEECDKKRGC